MIEIIFTIDFTLLEEIVELLINIWLVPGLGYKPRSLLKVEKLILKALSLKELLGLLRAFYDFF